MDTGFPACLVIVAALLGLFACQYRADMRRRARLFKVILVNGTRGKSSTTRLIAAGLRAGKTGPVLGKTTGSSARWLLPAGTDKAIERRGPANIREMAAGLALAETLGAAVYVAECMAIRPEYQAIVKRWMRADVTVMTNIRPDHEDVLGQGRLAVAKGLAASLPASQSAGLSASGVLVAFPETMALLDEVCAFPRERVILAEPDLGREWLPLFADPVVLENLALALTVCSHLGVPLEDAARAMAAAATDPGSLEVLSGFAGGKKVNFVGAFAANDPESTLLLAGQYPAAPGSMKVLWFHARADRRQRTEALCAALRNLDFDCVIVSGDADFAAAQWPGAQMPGVQISGAPLRHGLFRLPLREETELEAVLARLPGNGIWLLGAGNAKGLKPQRLGEDTVCRRLSSA